MPEEESAVTATRLTSAQRMALERECVGLSIQGYDDEQIAEKLHLPLRQAHKLIQRALIKQAPGENVREVARIKQDMRLDRALRRQNEILDVIQGQALGTDYRVAVNFEGEEVAVKAISLDLLKYERELTKSMLEIEKRRAELWGLDAPKKVEQTNTQVDPVKQQVLDLLKKRDEQERSSGSGGPIITGSFVSCPVGIAGEEGATNSSGEVGQLVDVSGEVLG